MKHGDFTKASQTFSLALNQTKHAMQTRQLQISSGASANSVLAHSLSVECSFSRDQVMIDRRKQRKHMPTLATISMVDLEDCFLYMHPVFVHSNQHQDDSSFSEELLIEALSYATIFNLALCWQMRAIYDYQSVHEGYLKRAIMLYKHARKLLTHQESTTTESDTFHALVLANNMGHACLWTRNESTAKACFHRLLQAILRISNNDQQTLSRIRINNEESVEGFLSNTMLLFGSHSSAPAA